MTSLQPIKKDVRVAEEVFAQLRNAIVNGYFQPGDKLPTETKLIDTFKVSRTSVREATKLLSGQGMIVIKPGLGAYVAEYTDNTHVMDIQKILTREKETILELFQIRKFLDVEAANAAAQKASPAAIEEMEKILSEAELLAQTPKSYRQRLLYLNARFHFELVKSTGNRTLLKVMTSLMEISRQEREITTQLPGRFAGSVAGHRAILNAVKNHDSEKARMCMVKHLEAVENIVRACSITSE